jgi:hypothetical protein
MLKRGTGIRRNDRCICGSGKKFKYCCSATAVRQPGSPVKKTHYIDTGEVPVRYVITDEKGTSFFSTKDNQVIVFQNRADAIAIATLDDFAAAEAGEINVAGVGETKWKHLQEKLPFVEVNSAEEAAVFIRERMEHIRALLETEPALEAPQETPPADVAASDPPANPENA